MSPELAQAIEYLRGWQARAKATNDLDQYPTLLGEADAYVANLLAVVDKEQDQ